MELWTLGDMGRALGINPGYCANWGMPGHRRIPEPFAVTKAQGLRLFTPEQAKEIMDTYVADQRRRADRRAELDRAEQALSKLVAS